MAGDAVALTAWVDFPVSAAPRPIVLVDGYVHVGPSGFAGADAKIAFLTGAIDSRVEVPDRVLTLLTSRSPRPRDRTTRSITITAISQDEAPFLTDRGEQLFPAFALHFDGTREPVLVFDPATPVWWPKRPAPDSATGGTATIEPDGMTLHLPARGGALTRFLGCTFTEAETAVLAEPQTWDGDAGSRPVRAVGVSKWFPDG